MTEMTETKKVEVPEGFMTGKFPLKKRAYGGEQPGIKVGPFKIRLPLIHHEWSWTEMAAAMFLGVACLGAGVTTTMTTFGLDDPANIAALGFDENGVFLMALTFGVLNAICYYLPSLLGDPVVPGWITPAPGRSMMITPSIPTPIAAQRRGPTFSCRTTIDSSVTTIGLT